MSSQIAWITHNSRVLKDNPLHDPTERSFPVYLPPSFETKPNQRFPVVYLLTGHFGAGPAMMNWGAWNENIAERADRLIHQKKMRETIIVLPNCFTALGGSQYINSSAVGRYEDYLTREIVPWIDKLFPTIARPSARAVIGKSSGAYGSLVLAMRHPELFGVVGWRSGDAYFDFCYRKDIPKTLIALETFGGSVKKYLADWRKKDCPLSGGYADVINVLAMAACYAPNPKSPHGFDLPVDTRTGEWNEKIWKRWLQHDPLQLVGKHRAALKKLKYLYIECGTKDEYGLLYGSRQLSATLDQMKVRHHYEEFAGGHHNTTYRYEHVLSLVTKHMS